jgi:hypothetical protein
MTTPTAGAGRRADLEAILAPLAESQELDVNQPTRRSSSVGSRSSSRRPMKLGVGSRAAAASEARSRGTAG